MSLFKDFTKNLGGIIADSALNGLVQGIRASEFIGRYGGVLGDERATYITGGGQNVSESIEQDNNIFSQLKNSYYDSFTNSVSLSAKVLNISAIDFLSISIAKSPQLNIFCRKILAKFVATTT